MFFSKKCAGTLFGLFHPSQAYGRFRAILEMLGFADFRWNSVDFAEIEFPTDQKQEFERLEFMMDKGLMDRTDLIRHFNPDISEEDLKTLMDRVDENKKAEAEAQQPEQPEQPLFEGLKRLGTVST